MSIAMNLYYTGIGDNARKFAEEMESSGTANLIRKEAGNIRYEYFLPISQPETVLLIDIWVNDFRSEGKISFDSQGRAIYYR